MASSCERKSGKVMGPFLNFLDPSYELKYKELNKSILVSHARILFFFSICSFLQTLVLVIVRPGNANASRGIAGTAIFAIINLMAYLYGRRFPHRARLTSLVLIWIDYPIFVFVVLVEETQMPQFISFE